jgi:adenylate cyclase
VTDEPALDAEPSVDDLRKENARLARRVARVEATLREVEQIRDTNARLLARIRDELDSERRRSQDLLRNVLPQTIIDRLGAGEASIADRHEDVAVVFSDFVGFTEISSRLPSSRP